MSDGATACLALASIGGVEGSFFTAQRCSPWLSRHSHGDSNVTGGVQAAAKPIAGAKVTLYAAGSGAPMQLAQAKTHEQGTLKLTYADAPAHRILYVIAKCGTPKAATSETGQPF